MASVHQLVVFFLLCSSTIILAKRTTKIPTKTSLNEAQDKFLDAQSTIIRIRTGELIGDSLDDLKTRLIALQSEVEKLVESSKPHNSESGSCEDAMQSMKNSYNAIDDRMRILQMEFEQHGLYENRSILLRQIVEDIRGTHFKLADEKFTQLNDISAIPKIVHEVYAHSEDNFGLILNFAVAVSNSDNCFTVLKTLYEEMSTNGHLKPLKLIILAKAVENEIKRHNTSDLTLRDELVRQTKLTAGDVLIKAMKFGDFSTNDEIKALLEALYDFSPKVSDEVMQRLVDETYGKVESRALLAHIFIQCNTPQAISGIENLFWKIKEVGHLNDSVLVLDIASNLSELIARDDFSDISSDLQDSMEKVVKNIPECARNLFFEPSVCLWNKAREAYLLATNVSFRSDGERRWVFTTPSDDAPHSAAWIPEKKGDDILFRSEEFAKEYLYFAEIEHNAEMRYLFSWIEGHNKDKQSAFKVELLDDGMCYLKSTRYNEYMYAPNLKYEKNNDYSYVFSWKPGTTKGFNSDFVWQIRGC